MRIRPLLFVLCLAVPACNSDEGPDDETYVATLAGANENPPRQSNATGSAKFTINANRTISYDLIVNGITTNVVGQHIHGPIATDTSNATIMVDLAIGTNLTLTEASFTRGVSYDSLLAVLRRGDNRAYVNVHSAQFTGGEIRGNLRRQ